MSFLQQCDLVVFLWSQGDSKTSQASRTLLSILADHNISVVWMITYPLIFDSSIPLTNFLGIFPTAPITIGITVTFLIYSFFLVLLQVLSTYLSFRLHLFSLCGPPGLQSPVFDRFTFFYQLSPFHLAGCDDTPSPPPNTSTSSNHFTSWPVIN